jgi:hypothetical protein
LMNSAVYGDERHARAHAISLRRVSTMTSQAWLE